jgi:hypothetical protein
MGLLKQYRTKTGNDSNAGGLRAQTRAGSSLETKIFNTRSSTDFNFKTNTDTFQKKKKNVMTMTMKNDGDHSRDTYDSNNKKESKWKNRRAGQQKERRIRILRSEPIARALTENEIEKMFKRCLQPKKAKYGGAGFARESMYININDESFLEKFQTTFDEHVEGFNSGRKSFSKLGKEEMLWKQKLKEKRAKEIGRIIVNNNSSKDNNNNNDNNNTENEIEKNKRRKIEQRQQRIEDDTNKPQLSRKQKKLALRRGETLIVINSNNSNTNTNKNDKMRVDLENEAREAFEKVFSS